ncbi:MAG TPA: hypothetical protein DD679_11775, partial [Pantoea agglomerans]|nr:hypothetical protein [Pantoea agglomerans]
HMPMLLLQAQVEQGMIEHMKGDCRIAGEPYDTRTAKGITASSNQCVIAITEIRIRGRGHSGEAI